MTYTLTDDVIANLAQLVQLAIMTGTDITDHLRQVQLEPSELNKNKLSLGKTYAKEHDKRIAKLVKEAEKISKAMTEKTKTAGFVN